MTQAYPLAWPEGWKRTKSFDVKSGAFRMGGGPGRMSPSKRIDMSEAVRRVHYELQRLGVKNPRDDSIISTNLKLNMSGLPRMDQGEPMDRGAAVYWQAHGQPMRVIACDAYNRVIDNIAATLEAMRAIERHGGAVVMERAFAGFASLPPPASAKDWWQVLGVPRDAGADAIRAAHRKLAAEHHPDKPGGSDDKMSEINRARDAGLAERTLR